MTERTVRSYGKADEKQMKNILQRALYRASNRASTTDSADIMSIRKE